MKICSACDRCFKDGVDECPDHGELREGPHSVDIVAGYLIERVIASSPNAVIYQAKNIEYGQECVVSIADSRQFVSDAKIAAGLFNAGVAGVIESGELADGSGFAVFEGFTGTSLRDILNDGDLSLLDRIQIARQAAEAVHALHLAGLNQGAIRPENVSINGLGTEELTVKIHNIDLGSAFATGVLSNRFAMDSSLELLRYFAPERFRGEPVTVQSDVYSLGLLLYEILSGHPPFEATSTAALADMHLNQKPPEIKIENFDLRMLLTHTIYEALQKQPSFRQSTADLFARQMRHIEQLATHVSTPPPAVAIAAAAATSPVRAQDPSVARAVAPPEIRAEPIATVAAIEAAPPIEQPAPALTHSITVEDPLPFVQPESKRSRLKGMKKRVHSHISNARAALRSTPTLIEWNQPPDDIPSIDAVREELTRSGEPLSFDADEEITHVRAVERIEVDWSEPVRTTPEIAAEFLPTIDSKPSVESASMFAGYHSQGRGVGRLPVYAVGAFAMILIGFGFFRLASALSGESDAYVGEYRPTPLQVLAPKQAEPVEQPAPIVGTPAEPVSIPAVVEQPEIDEIAKAKTEVPLPIKAVPVASKEPAKEPQRPTSQARVSEPAPIIVGQSASRATPIVPSTFVITRGDRTRQTVVAGASSQKPKVIVVGTGATRPRIVSQPN